MGTQSVGVADRGGVADRDGFADSAMSAESNEPAFGFSSEEIADLRKEFDAADVEGTGRLKKGQLIDLLFRRLFYSRPGNLGATLDPILQRTAYLQSRATGASTDALVERNTRGSAPLPNAEALAVGGATKGHSKDSLTGEGVNGAVLKIPTPDPSNRQKTVTPSSEESEGSRGEAARRGAAAKRRHSLPVTTLEGGGLWGVPDPTVQDRLRNRRPSFVATDAPLKMLPKEYVEDTATAKVLAKQGSQPPILISPGTVPCSPCPLLLANFTPAFHVRILSQHPSLCPGAFYQSRQEATSSTNTKRQAPPPLVWFGLVWFGLVIASPLTGDLLTD